MDFDNSQFLAAVYIFIPVTIAMFYFAYLDQKSLRKGSHTDLKSVIVSLGVLGTFIGIFMGLWSFDTQNINDSVPLLLEGLKLAFATSIVGMFISILLSAIQKTEITGGDDQLAVLNEINLKLLPLNKLDNISEQLTGLRLEFRDEQKETRTIIEKSNQTLSSMNTKFDNLVTTESLNKFRVDVHEEQLKSRLFLEDQFKLTNESLEKAIDVLSRGATEEIIKALEIVISDFNKNLTEQFGESFKELNQAVFNLVTWQEEFKDIVEHDYSLLEGIRDSLSTSSITLTNISERNKEVMTVYEQLKDLIQTYHTQLTSLNSQLETYSAMGLQASKAFETLSSGFEKVQSGLGIQSETIAKLTQEISLELPKSLGNLENTLVSLTQKFAQDYESFLDNYKNLIK